MRAAVSSSAFSSLSQTNWGSPIVSFWGVIPSKLVLYLFWHLEIFSSEFTNQFLSPLLFASLASSFLSVPGIRKCKDIVLKIDADKMRNSFP